MPLLYGLGTPLRFYLPPIFIVESGSGTGRTLTGSLIETFAGRPLFRVDLGLLVSKYIGETEKNLGRLLDQAEAVGGVLLIDNADALFRERASVKDAHGRFTNALINFLLLRLEYHPAVVILTSNMSNNPFVYYRRRVKVLKAP